MMEHVRLLLRRWAQRRAQLFWFQELLALQNLGFTQSDAITLRASRGDADSAAELLLLAREVGKRLVLEAWPMILSPWNGLCLGA